jgi:FMN-dependent dehydrogenase
MSRVTDQTEARGEDFCGCWPRVRCSPILSLEFGSRACWQPTLQRRGCLGLLTDCNRNGDVITSPDQALDVLDFEPAARKALPPAHFGYLATGVDDDGTVRANREGYSRIQIRPRRLLDVEKIDMSVRLFGATWSNPIVICPVSSQKAFHAEGDVAVARAARAKDHLQILSTAASSSIEDVIAARHAPVWQQLYPTNVWKVGRAIVKRAEKAGSPAIVFTVDLQEGSNRETLFRSQLADKRECSACHRSCLHRLRPRKAWGSPGDSPNQSPESQCSTASMFRRSPPCARCP